MRANPFFGVCLYCIIVKKTIYELLIEVFAPAVLARDLKNRQKYNYRAYYSTNSLTAIYYTTEFPGRLDLPGEGGTKISARSDGMFSIYRD